LAVNPIISSPSPRSGRLTVSRSALQTTSLLCQCCRRDAEHRIESAVKLDLQTSTELLASELHVRFGRSRIPEHENEGQLGPHVVLGHLEVDQARPAGGDELREDWVVLQEVLK
jgi:hypothetical protein